MKLVKMDSFISCSFFNATRINASYGHKYFVSEVLEFGDNFLTLSGNDSGKLSNGTAVDIPGIPEKVNLVLLRIFSATIKLNLLQFYT